MHAINDFIQGLFLAATLLISFDAVSALPTSEVSVEARNSQSLHDCSVYIQRWCNDCGSRFDVAYYNTTWTTPWNWPGSAWWNQETDSIDISSVGDELIPVKVGSNTLHITDTADPDESNPHDAGKLSFKWGTQAWDSWSKGSPCDVQPAAEYGLAAGYACRFKCDS